MLCPLEVEPLPEVDPEPDAPLLEEPLPVEPDEVEPEEALVEPLPVEPSSWTPSRSMRTCPRCQSSWSGACGSWSPSPSWWCASSVLVAVEAWRPPSSAVPGARRSR